MRLVTIALVCLLAVGPGGAVEFEGNSIKFSDQEMENCAELGGCIVITRRLMNQLIKEAETAPCRLKA